MEKLTFLLGTWRGSGHQHYPTVGDAPYEEELRFTNAGEPFLTYAQRAWSPATGVTFHAEAGFWRMTEDGWLEICLGHPLGLAEVSEGTVSQTTIHLRSTLIGRTATGEPVASVERRYSVEGEMMTYDLWMALDHVPLAHHLHATLRRTSNL